MQVLTIEEYHAEMMRKYQKAVDDCNYPQGNMPNIAFYLFYDEQGNQRDYGFVATDSFFNKACWSKTRIGSIRKFNKFSPSYSISSN